MTEALLHYVWKHQFYTRTELKQPNGKVIEVIKTGLPNFDAGPDFFNGQIKLDNTLWAGNVEIHTRASDWKKHHHHKDKAYDNVIIHLVKEKDCEVQNTKGENILTVELKYPEHFDLNYLELLKSNKWISCENTINEVNNLDFKLFLNRLVSEKLETKTKLIEELYKANKNNWEETFYQLIARSFGFKTNGLPFELLAKSIKLKYLGKHKSSLKQMEAFLFGQAGFLEEDIEDNYYILLKKEYRFLQNKFKLKPIEKHYWKFLRLRPNGFPTIRITQFAMLIHTSSSLFSKILECENINQLENLFSVQASDYWSTHFKFGHETNYQVKKLGISSIHNILINTVIPLIFYYGVKNNNQKFRNLALDLLDQLPAEKNAVIKQWNSLNIKAENAVYSQALIYLKNSYCDTKNCLNCVVGKTIVKKHANTN